MIAILDPNLKLISLIALASLWFSGVATAAERLNVVFILADDLHPLHAHGRLP